MPRLNLGLGNRENVKSSLIKVDLKSNYAQLPALPAFSKREASSVHQCRLPGICQGLGRCGGVAGEYTASKRSGAL